MAVFIFLTIELWLLYILLQSVNREKMSFYGIFPENSHKEMDQVTSKTHHLTTDLLIQ